MNAMCSHGGKEEEDMARAWRSVGIFVFASICGLASNPAWCAEYPDKPVRIVVPYGAGGTTDIVTRILGQKLTELWGQQVVVDNRGGAGGIIGTELVARAPADGYTILMGTVSTHGINLSLYKKIPYDPIKDFAPITLVALTQSVLMLHPSVPASSVKDLIALAKAKPGQLNFGSAGFGGSQHLAGVLFGSMAGVKITHVPFKSTAAALVDLMSGQVQFMFDTLPSAMPFVKGAKLKALAVTGLKRSSSLPDLPTVSEAGVPGFETTAWYGALAPAGTPQAVIRKLNTDFVRTIGIPDIQERIVVGGAEPVASTPLQFAEFIRNELSKWAKVVRESGATVD